MQTNKTIPETRSCIERGRPFWMPLTLTGSSIVKSLEASAVVYLEADNGYLVIFTRGEYKNALMSVVSQISGDPDNTREAFFE